MSEFDVNLPSSWSWWPLKHATRLLSRGTAPDYVDDGPVRMISQAANQAVALDWTRTRFHEFYGDARKLKGYLLPRDVLINSTGTGTLGRVGFFLDGPDERPCVADGHVTVARSRSGLVDSRFLYYWLASSPFQEYIYAALVVGATNQIELNRERLATASMPLPPLDEQRRIADFLDLTTARIDRMVGLRKQQLELLQERFLAKTIGSVRGADATGRRVESGLTWLGTVPASWPVAPVTSQFDVQLGKMLSQDRIIGKYLKPYLRNINVQWDYIDTDNLLLMNFPPQERRRFEVLKGDLLICEGGEPGRAAIWDGSVSEIYYQKALHRARSRGRSSVRWLYYCLRAATALNVFEVEGNTTTIAHLTGEQLRVQRFPFPEPRVQDRLVSKLDSRAAADRRVAAAINTQLTLLIERRQALITAAVTGQMDVTTAGRVTA